MRLWLPALALAFLAACRCGPTVTNLQPSIAPSPAALDFGQVKSGSAAVLTLTLRAQAKAAVTISSVTLEPSGAVGPLSAFTVGTVPTRIEPLSTVPLDISFRPVSYEAYAGTLVIASDDPDHPQLRVPVLGEGAKAIIEVTLDCASSRNCVGTVVVAPPSIDFGPRPYQPLTNLDPSRLPTVTVANVGPVPLSVTRAAMEGADALAFTFAGNSQFPDGGLTLDVAAGFNLALRFDPLSEQQQSYAATLAIESDDPVSPRITIPLTGTLSPNLAPNVCMNLVRVVPPAAGDPPRDYATEWPSLLVPPAGGYDLRLNRDVRPGDLVVLSAFSNATDAATCTNDPEDGRTGLTYQWVLTQAPVGATGLPVSGSTQSQAQLRPVVTGEYTMSLTVKDQQLHATQVTLRFAVAIKEDLVAQLQWPGGAGIDLDLHLVRPSAADGGAFSGVFDPFHAGVNGTTAGDVNGYAVSIAKANPGAGYDFDWGDPGASDNPKLNVDDTGAGPLVENISLNFPENDGRCATVSCSYKLVVHSFNDARTGTGNPCTVDGGAGCLDGEACSCLSPQRCVAQSAPVGDAGLGSGTCTAPPQPVVRIFLKGSPTPAAVIPLDTLVPADALAIGAPCQTLFIAQIDWPAKSAIGSLPDGGTPPAVITVPGADGTGRVVAPVLGRFGYRQPGSRQCSPDDSSSAVQWYTRQP